MYLRSIKQLSEINKCFELLYFDLVRDQVFFTHCAMFIFLLFTSQNFYYYLH